MSFKNILHIINIIRIKNFHSQPIMFFWVFGRSYVESQVNKGRETPFIKMFYPVCKYIYVPVCFLVLILGIALGGIG